MLRLAEWQSIIGVLLLCYVYHSLWSILSQLVTDLRRASESLNENMGRLEKAFLRLEEASHSQQRRLVDELTSVYGKVDELVDSFNELNLRVSSIDSAVGLIDLNVRDKGNEKR